MSRTPVRMILAVAALAFSAPARAADPAPPPFEWKDGDRVVLVGDTLIERDQKYGYLETLITAQNPDKTITFRNLGWSGDTARGLSRARFGPPAEGWQHLIDHVNALKPTVLIVGYGMAESFDGDAVLPAFVSGLNALIDATSASKPRLIFLSPIAHEDFGHPLPVPSALNHSFERYRDAIKSHNHALERYRDAIKKIADERGGWFVDLYKPAIPELVKSAYLTDDGIHLTASGYWNLGLLVEKSLRRSGEEPRWEIKLVAQGPGANESRTKVSGLDMTPDRIRFQLTDTTLPAPDAPRFGTPDFVWPGAKRSIIVPGLKAGRYTLAIDGRTIQTLSADRWARGMYLVGGPEDRQVEALRAAINAKNELYFYRWRPQNETYLLGFRKHEQGNNASEIPLFDPLVEAQEKEIARLRKPVSHLYELTRESEAAK